jgi:hypothetical protein
MRTLANPDTTAGELNAAVGKVDTKVNERRSMLTARGFLVLENKSPIALS